MLEPILVRKRTGGYEIVAGERRWRAAQKAGIYEVPVFVRELSEPRRSRPRWWRIFNEKTSIRWKSREDFNV